MKRHKTPRLFYGRYPYKIDIQHKGCIGDIDYYNGCTAHSCKKWLNDNKIDHKSYSSVTNFGSVSDPTTCSVLKIKIFLSNRSDFDTCIDMWKDSITAVTEPHDQSQVDLLKQDATIICRDRLYHGRYRYALAFRRNFDRSMDDLEAWLVENLEIHKKQRSRWMRHGWSPRLYLELDTDLVLVKLTWGEKIRSITMIKTWDELGSRS